MSAVKMRSDKFLSEAVAQCMMDMSLIRKLPEPKPLEAKAAAGAFPLECGDPEDDEDVGQDVNLVLCNSMYAFLGEFDSIDSSVLDAEPEFPNDVPALHVNFKDLTMPWLTRLCKWLEYELWEKEFGICAGKHESFALDIKKDAVVLRSSCTLSTLTALVFAGPVCLQRTPCSHAICKVSTEVPTAAGFDSDHEEQDPGDGEGAGVAGATKSTKKIEIGIFVRGDTLMEVITECPVLAWMVKPITEQPKAKAKAKSAPPAPPQLNPANMKVVFEKATLSLPPGLVVSGQATIEIAVPMLRPLADIVSGAEPTVLLREPLALDAKKKRGKAGQAAAIGILDLLGADALVKRLQHQQSADDADMAVAKAVGRQKPALSDFGHLFR